MSSIYDQDWTIRGLVDVTSDIFLLPGDELRILGEGTGPYHVVVNRGNRIWEKCRDLTPHPAHGPIEPTVGIEEPANSVNVSDGGVYHEEIRGFINNVNAQWQCLKGTLPVAAGDVADVTVWAPKMGAQSRRILIIKAEHRSGGLQQNGTGHGDHR